jgi:hypothetical protein
VDTPAVPGRGPRAETVLATVLVVVVLVVAAGFLFDLPFGFGGWELAVVATPIALAVVAVAVVLRTSRKH